MDSMPPSATAPAGPVAPEIRVFGIRHHGPGSARSLRRALDAWQPDCVLVEGPPDAEEVLPLLRAAGMRPPVALLVHAADAPQQAVFYPFAAFSPEWQALEHGLARGVTVRFMDLPQTYRLALQAAAEAKAAAEPPAEQAEPPDPPDPSDPPDPAAAFRHLLRRDPLRLLAEAAGCADSERWWEHMVEARRESGDPFPAILEAMTALRDAATAAAPAASPAPLPDEELLEPLREAWMRQTIRAARREGWARIAVVCGAWHAPALALLPSASQDAALLKGLPKTKVRATWVPWTYSRLCSASGYGAGVTSPGWYEHLWESTGRSASAEATAIRWLARVAALLREDGIDVSSAHVIEAVRLATALAALRAEPLPGLLELEEACLAVFCQGDRLPLRLIARRLIVSEVLGEVPPETPHVPLQRDLEATQKRLRLPLEAGARVLDLDLRKENDLARSHLLHRLRLLGIPWGEPQRRQGRSAGTFHEVWQLQWQPEFAVRLIEASRWGNSLADAATGKAGADAAAAEALPEVTALLQVVLLADLPDAARQIMDRLAQMAALTSDTGLLLEALPPLADVLRYGNVRQTDTAMVAQVVDGLITRIAIGLPNACHSLNDEAARAMYTRLAAVNAAVVALAVDAYRDTWHGTLARLADQAGLHGIVAGYACRVLLDAGVFAPTDFARRLALALSPAVDPALAAAWVEGFLTGSGLLLLHDDRLWAVVDDWVAGLRHEAFPQVLPLLRRTFSTFAAGERRQIGERVKASRTAAGPPPPQSAGPDDDHLDLERSRRPLPLLARILGLE